MSHRNHLLSVSLLVLTLASPAFAQTADTTVGTTVDGAATAGTTVPGATTPDATTTTGTTTVDTTATGTAGAAATVDTSTTATTGTQVAATPMTAAECDSQYTSMDADANGSLSEAEAPQAFARARVDNATIADGKLSKDAYIASCSRGTYVAATPEDGAPFDGANSFTMGQAQDRAVAWGVTEVSELKLDDKGVWRGTGKVNGAAVSVAVDFKGNVVTAAG